MSWHEGYIWIWEIWGVITAKIKFGILLCCFPMRFLIFSLVFLMFSMMFAKTSLLFCYFCIPFFQTSMLLFVFVCCYGKPRCYYSCPYAVMRNLDAIIRVRMLLCETSMLLAELSPISIPYMETRTTTWNLPGPSGTRDCTNIVTLSHPSPPPPPSSVEANTDVINNQGQKTLKIAWDCFITRHFAYTVYIPLLID